jgi:phosphate/sulfate permease
MLEKGVVVPSAVNDQVILCGLQGAIAWILTIPCSAGIAALCYLAVRGIW